MQRTIDGLCVTIIRKSIKNMHLRVLSPDGEIQITAPNRLPLSQIDRFVREKRGWIEARQQQLAERPRRDKSGICGRADSLSLGRVLYAPVGRSLARKKRFAARAGNRFICPPGG